MVDTAVLRRFHQFSSCLRREVGEEGTPQGKYIKTYEKPLTLPPSSPPSMTSLSPDTWEANNLTKCATSVSGIDFLSAPSLVSIPGLPLN
jgi:hypothetical protein